MAGRGKLKLTGQLGDVMKESTQIALSFLEANAEKFGIKPPQFADIDIHVHVPAGAIPKDGPSAGVTMFTALFSLMTGRRVRSDTAMTGEITLRGLVLPVGGIKNKVLAAHRGGIKRIILPERNRKDLEEIPDQVRREVEFIFVGRIDDLLPQVIDLSDGRPLFVTDQPTIAVPLAPATRREDEDDELPRQADDTSKEEDIPRPWL